MAALARLPLLPALCLTAVTLHTLTPGCQAQQQRALTQTRLGNVSGFVSVLLNQNLVEFRGIPYAEPPVNERRFSRPVPVRPWRGTTLDASRYGPSCPQPGQAGTGTSEDCLYLNIYVRANNTINPDGPKPVMIWIHGGAFQFGSGRGVDGSLMAVRGNVVVVTINYRLGLLGWLSTMDDASPGNNGLWDQRLAIQWVRDHIGDFGGDPEQITIFGESGGGYSVGLHTLSPLNMGLFHRAIMQSGSALNRRTIAHDPVGLAQRFAVQLGCLDTSSPSPDGEDGGRFNASYLIQCGRQRSVADILGATQAATTMQRLEWLLPVAPVVDGELIPADPRTLIGPAYRGRVPFWEVDIMVGTTNAEGSLLLSPLLPYQGALGFSLAAGIPSRVLCEDVAPALARDYFSRGSRNVSEALCHQYLTEGDDGAQGRSVVDLYGDMMFVSPAVETLQLHANMSNSQEEDGFELREGGRDDAGSITNTQRRARAPSRYQYLFSYAPTSRQGLPWFRGAGHGAEIPFVFGMNMRDRAEAGLALAMLDGWTNFAKFGTPNDPSNPPIFRWPAYDSVNKSFTNLSLVLTSARDLYGRKMDFWLQTISTLGTEFTPLTPRPPTDGLVGTTTSASSTSGKSAAHGHNLSYFFSIFFTIFLSAFVGLQY